jgi:hypothetical protein
MRTIALLLLPLLYQPAAGQAPRAVITGPKESRPGSLVVLDATESQGLGRIWLLAVSPEPTSFLPVEAGLKVIFASPTPGDYTFVLVVSGTNANGGPMADMATHTVTLLAPRPPPPTLPADPVQPPPTDPTQPPLTTKPTAAVYVYEKDRSTPPPAVTAALHRLNTERESFLASAVDQDVTTGTGTVPAQFQAAIGAAKTAGLPALVVLAGDQVLRVVRDPKTEVAVLEAVP